MIYYVDLIRIHVIFLSGNNILEPNSDTVRSYEGQIFTSQPMTCLEIILSAKKLSHTDDTHRINYWQALLYDHTLAKIVMAPGSHAEMNKTIFAFCEVHYFTVWIYKHQSRMTSITIFYPLWPITGCNYILPDIKINENAKKSESLIWIWKQLWILFFCFAYTKHQLFLEVYENTRV